jgi:hypothetical protein
LQASSKSSSLRIPGSTTTVHGIDSKDETSGRSVQPP